jgi:hypothetical protein
MQIIISYVKLLSTFWTFVADFTTFGLAGVITLNELISAPQDGQNFTLSDISIPQFGQNFGIKFN